MKNYGLIGRKLNHSFSENYFVNKFKSEGISNANYRLYEVEDVQALDDFLSDSSTINGLNVTIPFKQQVIPFLDDLDISAKKVGAVNVIKMVHDRGGIKKIGYNTDFLAFKKTIEDWRLANSISALILGTGGAAKAVSTALNELGISFKTVSRTAGDYNYNDLLASPEIIEKNKLIVNTTPLGMHPEVQTSPELPYFSITNEHYLYDLVYNPTLTTFLKLGRENGANIKNGLEMLHLQAEYSWTIWNS